RRRRGRRAGRVGRRAAGRRRRRPARAARDDRRGQRGEGPRGAGPEHTSRSVVTSNRARSQHRFPETRTASLRSCIALPHPEPEPRARPRPWAPNPPPRFGKKDGRNRGARSSGGLTDQEIGVKSNQKRWLGIGVAIAAAGAGIIGFRTLRGGGEEAVSYATAPVTRGRIASQVTATGTLSPLVTVQVGSQVSGRIQELHADFNSEVKKGQVIAKIDPQIFQAEVARARANLTAASASVARAQAEARDAKQTWERTSSLASRGIVASAEADSARASYDAASAQVSAARAALSQARAAV